MKVSEMIENLKKIMDDYGDLDLVCAKDDEGNGYNTVYYEPSVGYYDAEDREFYSASEEDYSLEFKSGEFEINSVCIN